MICFASICPHPPIIIPTIGGPNLPKVKKTIEAMEKLAADFAATNLETVIIISPHGPVEIEKMTVNDSENLSGNFAQFGDFQTQLEFQNDRELIDYIKKANSIDRIPLSLIDSFQLDHGALVPIYYLMKNCANIKLVPIAFSFLDYQNHFRFGQAIGQVIKSQTKRVAIIASGDLSHRVTKDAPAGYSPRGKEFDEKLIELLKNNDVKEILNLDEKLIEEAGECGLRSIIILLGALSKFQVSSFRFRALSYEAPFGVGYLVAQYLIKDK